MEKHLNKKASRKSNERSIAELSLEGATESTEKYVIFFKKYRESLYFPPILKKPPSMNVQ